MQIIINNISYKPLLLSTVIRKCFNVPMKKFTIIFFNKITFMQTHIITIFKRYSIKRIRNILYLILSKSTITILCFIINIIILSLVNYLKIILRINRIPFLIIFLSNVCFNAAR